MRRDAWLLSILTLFLAFASACGKSRATTKPTPLQPTAHSQMTGVFVGVAQNGRIDLSLDAKLLAPALGAPAGAETVVTANATMSPDGGSAIILNGTYNTSTGSLHLTGQGYTLAGIFLLAGAPSRLQGEYSSPSDSGSFVALLGSGTSVQTFCATYENATATMWGTLDLAVAATSIAGFEVVDGGVVVHFLAGTAGASGASRTLAFAGNPFSGTGTWTTATGHVEGTWMAGAESGVWSGDRCLTASTASTASTGQSAALP